MTKDLDQKVAHAMGLKSVNNCEKWGASMDVDKLLVEAGAYFAGDGVNYDRFEPRKFANLVAKHTLMNIDPSKFISCQEVMEAARLAEREACAKVCEQSEIPIPIDVWHGGTKKEMTKHTALALANAIRARGQA